MAWNALADQHGGAHFFQTFDYAWRLWRHVAEPKGRRLHLLVGRAEGRVVLIWPLMMDGRCLRFLSSDKCEYRDVLVEDSPQAPHWLRLAWQFIRTETDADYVHFQDVDQGSGLSALLRCEERRGWVKAWSSRLIDLDAFSTWRDYEEALPKKLRQDQKRQWRRLRDQGAEPRFRVLEEWAEALWTLDWILERKAQWMRENEIPVEGFVDSRYTAFIRALAEDDATRSKTLTCNLTVDDRIVSAALGFVHRGRFTFWNFAYDEEWRAYSPSRLLLEEIIKWCLSEGLSEFDFMPGDTGYKERWARQERVYLDFIFPLTRRAGFQIGFLALTLMPLLGKLSSDAVRSLMPRPLKQAIRRNAPLSEYAEQLERL